MSSVVARPSISTRLWGAYGVLGLVAASHGITHAYSALLPLVYPLVMQELDFSYSQLGVMLGVANIAGGVLQLAFGYLGRFFRRKTMLAGQNLALSLVMVFTGLATSFLPFVACILGGKVAQAPQHPVGNSLVSELFGKRLRGSALAINYAGGNVGAVVVPMIATALIIGVGWRWTMVLFALPGIIVAALLTYLINEGETAAATGERPSGNPLREAIQILSDRTVLLIILASAVAAGGRGLGVVMTWVPLYLRNGLGIGAEYVGVLFTVLMIGSVVGPLVAGRISDRLGRKGVLVVAYLIATASNSGLTLMTGQDWLLPAMVLFLGFSSYAEHPLMQTFLADSTRRKTRDLAFGIYFATVAVAGALWASLTGYLVDTQGFVFSFHVMALSYVGAAVLCMLAREQRGE